MSKENKKLITEAFRLNRSDDIDREIIEFLSTSNNKSALIKDALGMYKEMVNRGLYVSPFIKKNSTDWDRVLSSINPTDVLTGRRPAEVKEEVKNDIREYHEYKQQKAVEPVIEIDDEGDADNDIDF